MKHVIIGGDSYISSLFINKLVDSLKDITIIYPAIKYAESLPRNFKGNIVIGNLEKEDTLVKANIQKEDTVLIWSKDEGINTLLAVAVKKVYNVKNVAAFSSQSENDKLYKKLNIELIDIKNLFHNDWIMPTVIINRVSDNEK